MYNCVLKALNILKNKVLQLILTLKRENRKKVTFVKIIVKIYIKYIIKP